MSSIFIFCASDTTEAGYFYTFFQRAFPVDTAHTATVIRTDSAVRQWQGFTCLQKCQHTSGPWEMMSADTVTHTYLRRCHADVHENWSFSYTNISCRPSWSGGRRSAIGWVKCQRVGLNNSFSDGKNVGLKPGLKARDKRGGNMNPSAVASNWKHTVCYKLSCSFAWLTFKVSSCWSSFCVQRLLLTFQDHECWAHYWMKHDGIAFIALILMKVCSAPFVFTSWEAHFLHAYGIQTLSLTLKCGLTGQVMPYIKKAVYCIIAVLLLCWPQHYSFGSMPSTHVYTFVIKDCVHFLAGWWANWMQQ